MEVVATLNNESPQTSRSSVPRQVRLKGVVLPTEHGSWGFLFEPLLAALLVTLSAAGLWIAVMIVGAFLVRQPLKIYLGDRIALRYLPQTEVALKFVFYFGAVFVTGLAASIIVVPRAAFLPFLFVLPLGIYQVYCDASRQSRQLLPEFTGAIAISSSAAVIALATGWAPINAYVLWLIFAARLIPSILYVRNRLRLEKNKEFQIVPVIASHFIAFGLIGMLAANGLASKLTLFMFFVLLCRSVWGISPYRKRVKAMRIGIWEVVYGSLTAVSVVLGFYLGF